MYTSVLHEWAFIGMKIVSPAIYRQPCILCCRGRNTFECSFCPQPKPEVPPRPYRIGLTGGIASGKSNVCKELATLGAGVVNCDLLGNNLLTSSGKSQYNYSRK